MRGLFTSQQPPNSPVGASLLAKAVGQFTDSSTDTTPSRAGSLPQGNCAGFSGFVARLVNFLTLQEAKITKCPHSIKRGHLLNWHYRIVNSTPIHLPNKYPQNRQQRLVSFTSGLAISDDAHRPCRQTPKLVFGRSAALLRCFLTGYSPDVADPFSDRVW
ncbi:hypothetical protein PspCFBP13508_18370 [Pseudomonas sp. CFBP13508]|nr:hypothetical protein PspCFBP13508_18370 [Pseudomonas sp. CFBP13508]